MTLPADVEALRKSLRSAITCLTEFSEEFREEHRQEVDALAALATKAGEGEKVGCDYAHLPHSGGGTNHGPAVQSKGGYHICQKCYDAIIDAERKEEGYYHKAVASPVSLPNPPDRDEIVEEWDHKIVLPLRWDDYDGVVRDSENWSIPPRYLPAFVNALKSVPNAQGEALPARPPEGWISVEERLPECYGYKEVITADREGRVAVGDFWSEEKEFWPANGKGEYWASAWDDITHWQPLPHPPVAPKEEGK